MREAWSGGIRLRAMMTVLAFVAIAGGVAAESAVPSSAPTPVGAAASLESSAMHERGRGIFESKCYYCHGSAGNAATTAAAYLHPRPRDFTQLDPRAIDHNAFRRAVLDGRAGTAMPSFAAVLAPGDVDAVVEYIATQLAGAPSPRARYHEAAAGWSGAFPLLGDAPGGPPARRDAICLTCHESADIAAGAEPLRLDVVSAASPYASHAEARGLPAGATPRERSGERLFQSNCAFCHAADGSGGNWIGTFLEPHARDLRSSSVCNRTTLRRLPSIIADGLEGTSMPAWRGVLDRDEIDGIAAYVRAAFCRNGRSTP